MGLMMCLGYSCGGQINPSFSVPRDNRPDTHCVLWRTLAAVTVDKIDTGASMNAWPWKTVINVCLTVEAIKTSGTQAAVTIQAVLHRR